MKFLADHDVYKITVEFLRQYNHDVLTVKELDLHQASDKELLKKALETGRLFITRDKDFGMLIFLEREINPGVIFLRINPSNVNEVHNVLKNVLERYDEDYLKRVFCVIEPKRYRIRHIE